MAPRIEPQNDPHVMAPLRFLAVHGVPLSEGGSFDRLAVERVLSTDEAQRAGYRPRHVREFLYRLEQSGWLRGQDGAVRYFGPLPDIPGYAPPLPGPPPQGGRERASSPSPLMGEGRGEGGPAPAFPHRAPEHIEAWWRTILLGHGKFPLPGRPMAASDLEKFLRETLKAPEDEIRVFMEQMARGPYRDRFTGVTTYFNPPPRPGETPAAAQLSGAQIVYVDTRETPYWSTDVPVVPYTGDLAMDQRILAINRYNALVMVLRANKRSANIGGHLGTGQSVADLRQYLFNNVLQPQSGDFPGDVYLNEGHDSPLDYADAFLRGYLTAEHLDAFRQEDDGLGLPGYGHPRSDTDFPWEWATVSMGLAPQLGVQLAYMEKNLHARGLRKGPERHIWVMLGDASAAEPESRSDLQFAVENGLDNLTFIVNVNINGLDGVVLPNDRMVQFQERTFAGSGFNVIKLVLGSAWQELIAADEEAVRQRIAEMTDSHLQRFSLDKENTAEIVRNEFFGANPRLAALIANREAWTDQRLKDLFAEGKGGHDLKAIHNAVAAAIAHKGGPSVILALTTKGRGMGEMQASHIVHNEKKMKIEDLTKLAHRLHIPLTDEQIAHLEYYVPSVDDPVRAYLRKRETELGGDFYFGRAEAPRQRSTLAPPAQALPDWKRFAPFTLGQATVLGTEMDKPVAHSMDRYVSVVLPAFQAREDFRPTPVSTTSGLVEMLKFLMVDPKMGPYFYFVVADEMTTFGAHTLPPQFGYFDPHSAISLADYRRKRRRKEKDLASYGDQLGRAAKEIVARELRERGVPEADIPVQISGMSRSALEPYEIRAEARAEEFGLPPKPPKVDINEPVWVKDGQIIQAGINEARAMSFFTAAGKEGLIPVWVVYSAFGFRRVGDQILAATDMRARGFIIGATAGGTTLNGEGLLHQERADLLMASGNSAIVSYDPAFMFEMAAIVENGLRRMYSDGESLLYYVTAYNEPIPQPRMPGDTPEAQEKVREGIVRGMYMLSPAEEALTISESSPPRAGAGSGDPVSGDYARSSASHELATGDKTGFPLQGITRGGNDNRLRVKLLGSGPILLEQLKAQRLLAKYGVSADVYSVTSYAELRRDVLRRERELDLHHPGKTFADLPEAKRPYLMQVLGDDDAPIISATDYLKAVPDQIARWLPTRNYVSLGTDGFGRSSSRANLREYFEIAARWSVYHALVQLARQGKFKGDLVAIRDELGINPFKPDPSAADPRAERLASAKRKPSPSPNKGGGGVRLVGGQASEQSGVRLTGGSEPDDAVEEDAAPTGHHGARLRGSSRARIIGPAGIVKPGTGLPAIVLRGGR